MSEHTSNGDAQGDAARESPPAHTLPQSPPQPTIQIPQSPPPGLQYPAAPVPSSAPKNGMGLAALILGIAGAVLALVPFVGCIGAIAGVTAIVFGAIGIANANGGKATNRASAVTGLSLGIAALVLGLVITAIASNTMDTDAGESTGGSEADSTGAATEESGAAEPEAASGEAAESPPEPEGIGDGQWKVGDEIAPGTYVTWAEDSFMGCYAARLSGFSGEFDDIIANTNLSDGARGRITIAEGDAGVEFSGDCEWVPASEATLAVPDGDIGPGVWEVGTEVQPGTYVTQAAGDGFLDGCYVARLGGFSMEFEEIIANDNIDGGTQGRIEIADGDIGVEFTGECVWTLE